MTGKHQSNVMFHRGTSWVSITILGLWVNEQRVDRAVGGV